MTRIALLASTVAVLWITGCAGSAPKPAAEPVVALSAADFTPPGQDFQFRGVEEQKGTSRREAAISFRPATTERPSKGAVHAAH